MVYPSSNWPALRSIYKDAKVAAETAGIEDKRALFAEHLDKLHEILPELRRFP